MLAWDIQNDDEQDYIITPLQHRYMKASYVYPLTSIIYCDACVICATVYVGCVRGYKCKQLDRFDVSQGFREVNTQYPPAVYVQDTVPPCSIQDSLIGVPTSNSTSSREDRPIASLRQLSMHQIIRMYGSIHILYRARIGHLWGCLKWLSWLNNRT